MKQWFAIAVVTSLASVCLAQTKPPPPKETRALASPSKNEQKKEKPVAAKQEPKKAPTAKFSMGMIEGDRIDPGYGGLPVAEVVDAIEKLSGQKKGEFESTADFNARKAAALTGKFMGDSSVEDAFAFVVPVANRRAYLDGLKYDFNADTSEVRLFALAKSSSMNGIGAPDYQTSRRQSKGLDQFDLDFKVNSTRTYQASNAYGATVTVEETVSTRLGIAANRIPFLTYKRESYYSKPIPSVQFNMENAKAARELPVLKALIIMKLVDPYVVYDFMHSKPTRDQPTEMTSQGKYLTGNVLGIVFYSGLTGEVFARLPDTFGKPEPKPEPQPEGQ